MIEKLKLTNFRKVEDDTMVFGPGLQLIKAPNEGSKTTRLEAIAYALFGSKILRTNFAETVTWGKPEHSLKVELTLTLTGRTLTFTRGKSGAEVIEGGNVIVTGQNEVTSYAANLLGCDGAAAANLIIASQNAMRGSLEQGPKATAALIESLADFDLFDTLIDRIQTKLVVGAPASFEARVAHAEARVAAFEQVPAPDEAEYKSWLDVTSDSVKTLTDRLRDVLKPAFKAAEKEHYAADSAKRAYEEVLEDLARAEKTQASHITQRDQALEASTLFKSDPAALEAARQELDRAARGAEIAAAYDAFKKLPSCDHEFEGNHEAFATWLEGRKQALQEAQAQYNNAFSTGNVLAAKLVSSSVCGFCGQDVSAFPGVAEINAEINAEIEKLKEQASSIAAKYPEIEAEIAAGNAIESAMRKVLQVLPQLNGNVDVDHGMTPPQVRWLGLPPGPVDLAGAKQKVKTLEQEAEQCQQAKARVEAMSSILKEDEAQVSRLRAKADQCKPGDTETVFQTYIEAHRAVDEVENQILDYKELLDQRRFKFESEARLYNACKDDLQRLEGEVAGAKKDLADLAFNNTLLKKVRTARPIIADKLWNTVLSAVSTMFSQMRGEPSIVSKDNGGFKVNGQPIESLSGSTLDILGMAIRVALVKTFIPHASFMLLDEAAAACDQDRTGAMLGFIAGMGFQQVLLVTHDELSAGVADNVIEL